MLRRAAALCLALCFGPWVVGGCRVGYELEDRAQGLGGASESGGRGSGDGDLGSGDGDSSNAGGAMAGASGDGGVSDTGGAFSGGSAGSTGGGAPAGGTGGDQGTGGSSGGTSGSGGGSTGGGGSGGSGGAALLDLLVTTSQDEADAGASVDDPGQTGLSLREAILIANSEPGLQSISFEQEFTISLGTSSLPTIIAPLDLRGVATIDAANVTSGQPCLQVDSSDVLLTSLVLVNCPNEPILVASGSGNEISGNFIANSGDSVRVAGESPVVLFNFLLGSAGSGIDVQASAPEIISNQVQDVAGVGIHLTSSASGASLVSNLVFRASAGIGFDGPQGVNVWHNTVHQNQTGVDLGTASEVDFRNNIVAGSSGYGVVGTDSQFNELDYNLYNQNGSGDCSGCGPGPSALFQNPLFQNPGAGDYNLQASSPAIDAGFDLGSDRNLEAAGLYNGSGPDIGFVEAP